MTLNVVYYISHVRYVLGVVHAKHRYYRVSTIKKTNRKEFLVICVRTTIFSLVTSELYTYIYLFGERNYRKMTKYINRRRKLENIIFQL